MTKMTLITSLIIAATSFGCTRPDTLLVSNAFTDEERGVVISALEEWEYALDKDLGIDLVFDWTPVFDFSEDNFNGHDGNGTLFIVDRGSYGYNDVAKYYNVDIQDGELMNGYTRVKTKWSIVVVRQEEANLSHEENMAVFEKIMLHEFGHYIGLFAHHDFGIMRWDGGNQPCIDQSAVDKFCLFKTSCGDNKHETCTEKGY